MLGAGELFAQRVVFIIEKEGKITHILPKVDVKRHSDEVLRALEELKWALDQS